MKRLLTAICAVGAALGARTALAAGDVVASSASVQAAIDLTAENGVLTLPDAAALDAVAWNSASNWCAGGDEAVTATVVVQPCAGDPADRTTWIAAGEGTTLAESVGEGTATFAPALAKIYRFSLTAAGTTLEAFVNLTAAGDLPKPQSVAEAVISFSTDTFPYTGAPICPTATVSLDGTPLEEGKDFLCVYRKNVRPGAAAVTVYGMGAYGGFAGTSFTIAPITAAVVASAAQASAPCDLTGGATVMPPTVDEIFPFAWNSSTNGWCAGGDEAFAATVSVIPQTGASGDPASWSDAAEAVVITNACGEGTVAWLPEMVGYYKAVLAVNGAPKATACLDLSNTEGLSKGTPLDDFTLELSVSSVPCKGHFVEPDVTVSKEGVTLVRGVDYSVEYADNLYAGTATVTVRGIGHYTGSVSTTFEIAPVPPAELSGSTKGGVDLDTRIGPDGELHLHLSGERLDYVTFNSAAPAWPAGGDAAVTARVRLAPVSSVDEIPADGAYRTIAEGTGEQVKVGWHMGAKMVRVVLELFDGESWGAPVETRVIRYDRASGTLVIIR